MTKMKITSINLPQTYLDCIKILINLGYYPNRSDFIRQSTRIYLKSLILQNKKLDPKAFKEKMKELAKLMEET